MESYNSDTPQNQPPNHMSHDRGRAGRILGGLFIVVIGLLLLARQAGVEFPYWFFSFKTLLIAIGLYLGIRHSFRGVGWLIPLLIGGFLLLGDLFPLYEFRQFIWPLVVIVIGLFIMFQAGKRKPDWKKWGTSQAQTADAGDDYLDSTVVFGGVKRNVISKNFRGGESVTVFGGTEINLMQADLSGPVVLDLTQIFGGTKLIVPPHWKVHSKGLIAILGGIDDKQPPLDNAGGQEPDKTLIIEGTCLLGGIEIRRY